MKERLSYLQDVNYWLKTYLHMETLSNTIFEQAINKSELTEEDKQGIENFNAKYHELFAFIVQKISEQSLLESDGVYDEELNKELIDYAMEYTALDIITQDELSIIEELVTSTTKDLSEKKHHDCNCGGKCTTCTCGDK